MVALVAAVAFVPWAQPLRFRPLPGWQQGAGGTFDSSYGPGGDIASPKESTAWMAKGVRYRDRPHADPPDATLSRLPRRGIVVFAVSPEFASGQWVAAGLRGAFLGLFGYAVYDLTNQATLRNWPAAVTVADLTWGTLVTAVAAIAGLLAARAVGVAR